MAWIQTRIGRMRSFGGVVVALVLLSVSLSTALGYWWEKLGLWGIVVIGAAILLGLLAALLMPDTAWKRLTGESTFPEDLGRLHAEGVQLLHDLPRVADTDPQPLDEWEARAEDWRQRVVAHLQPRWDGVFLSPIAPTGKRYRSPDYGRATDLRLWLDERLERLSQIMSAVGASR